MVTGSRQQVDSQLAEITENSQHYLQLGLGEKLIGHSTVPIDESRQHGQVAIIKRGVMETIDSATTQAGLQLTSVDGALTCISRVAGIAGIDRSPLLVQALEQTKGSRLLADPHITVVDRHLATFEAKTRIPIQQLTQTQQGGSIGSTSFVDAGITLTVTPRIATHTHPTVSTKRTHPPVGGSGSKARGGPVRK